MWDVSGCELGEVMMELWCFWIALVRTTVSSLSSTCSGRLFEVMEISAVQRNFLPTFMARVKPWISLGEKKVSQCSLLLFNLQKSHFRISIASSLQLDWN